MLSTEQQDVVPIVVDTKNGTSPFLMSSSIAWYCIYTYIIEFLHVLQKIVKINLFQTFFTVSPRRQKFSSVSRIRNLVKAIMEPFSKQEWAENIN